MISTSDMRQLKTLIRIDKRGSKIARNSVFDCHLSPIGRQMAIENSVSNAFLSTVVGSIYVFDCRLPDVIRYLLFTKIAQFVERPLSEWEVVGSNPGRTIPKM